MFQLGGGALFAALLLDSPRRTLSCEVVGVGTRESSGVGGYPENSGPGLIGSLRNGCELMLLLI